jgi:cellulose synthase/poly-beta-1,6-N-acetylglucosamine synthase-like glycosyltransferase
MKLSFAIPAHDEEQLLPSTLRAIREAAGATGVPYEIIVADDASTDDTARVAREHGATVVAIDRRQIAAARNAAGRAATGDVLFFVDADTRIDADVVRDGLAAVEAGAVGGGFLTSFDGQIPLYARVLLPVVLTLFRMAKLTGGATMFCTRDAFDAVGGWDETLFASEEITFARVLKQHGHFVIPRSKIVTSARKLHDHSGFEIFGILLKLLWRGPKGVRRRDGLELWYGPRTRSDASTPSA